MSVVERESSLTALRWETLMNQRAAYATTLWTRIAAFSFVSSILITASFFDNVTTTQRVLLAYIRNCSGDSFYVNKFSARCLFFGRGIRDQISRRQPEGIGVSLKSKIRLAPKGPDKGSCICISRCFLGCLDISNHQYLHMIPKHSTTGDFEILPYGEFELLAAGPECTVGGTVFEM